MARRRHSAELEPHPKIPYVFAASRRRKIRRTICSQKVVQGFRTSCKKTKPQNDLRHPAASFDLMRKRHQLPK